ncbi:MAG: YbbR-like domain-containing protein, partial [Deltaproteobacteria bacterium]|nr:YbbR-like domain-containing protein [Deltaproteobacteria bacterium]
TLDRRVERSIPVEASLPHRPAFGYEIVSVRTEPREVKVIGPRSSVMGLDYIPTRDIDIRGREGDLEVEVALRNPPHPMKLITKQVFISIEIGEEQIQRMFRNIPVKVEAGGVALTVEPSTVMLRVSGPRRSVDAMKSSSLEATVKIGDELEKGLKSFEKSVELRTTLPERTQLVVPIPRVVVSVPE